MSKELIMQIKLPVVLLGVFFVVIFSVPFVHAQYTPKQVTLGTYCAMSVLYGCAQDDIDGMYYIVSCAPNNIISILQGVAAKNGLEWEKLSDISTNLPNQPKIPNLEDKSFSTLDECVYYCIETGSIGPTGIPLCVHDENFAMPTVRSVTSFISSNFRFQKPIAGCVAQDGVFACSKNGASDDRVITLITDSLRGKGSDVCKDADGCDGRYCFNMAPTLCGKQSYNTYYKGIVDNSANSIAENYAGNLIIAENSVGEQDRSTGDQVIVAQNSQPGETQQSGETVTIGQNTENGQYQANTQECQASIKVTTNEPPVQSLVNTGETQTASSHIETCDWLCGIGHLFGWG